MGQVDAYGAFLKEQHEFADGFLALPRVLDFLQDLFADPPLPEAEAAGYRGCQGFEARRLDDFFRRARAPMLVMRPEPKSIFDALDGRGPDDFITLDGELGTETFVPLPFSGNAQRLTAFGGRQNAPRRPRDCPTFEFDPRDRKAVVFVRNEMSVRTPWSVVVVMGSIKKGGKQSRPSDVCKQGCSGMPRIVPCERTPEIALSVHEAL